MSQPSWTTVEWWQARIGQVFVLSVADADVPQAGSAELRLAEAEGSPQQPRPFRLLFVGAPGLVVSQGTYRLRPADADAVDIFLVPMQPDASGTRFEAIFN